MERLQKVIANNGYTSRRKAEELIKKGRVKVNGNIVYELGIKVNPNDEIEIDGNTLVKEDKVYYILNKPRGIITSTNKGEPIVNDENALAGKAYRNVAQRILGEEVPFLDLDEPKGFVAKLKNVFAKLKAKV